jgi:hypothetical protein
MEISFQYNVLISIANGHFNPLSEKSCPFTPEEALLIASLRLLEE